MKHFILIGLFALLFFNTSPAQEQSVSYDKVTLVSGNIYIGTILLKNDEILMIKTTDGKRYQFPINQVKQIEKTISLPEESSKGTTDAQQTYEAGNFSGQLETGVGVSKSSLTLPSSPIYDASLCFGYKKMFNKDLFLGFGAGVNSLQISSTTNPINLVPIFLRLRSENGALKNSIFFGLDAGYSLSLSESYKGGAMIKASIGVAHHLTTKTSLYAGFYGAATSINGTVAYGNPTGTSSTLYYGEGSQSILSSGVKIGVQF